MVTDEEFLSKEWPQNCGDSLKILRKSEIKDKSSQCFWKCEFQKYPCKILATKSNVIRGTINNPQIEIEEFVKKEWPQNCGDVLRILDKQTDSKGKTIWRCQFVNYPCEVIAKKDKIIKGSINNPNIEKEEFIGKVFKQNCGDDLLVIEKSNKKYQEVALFRCQFQKYPYEVFETKTHIKLGKVLNPKIEENEFIGKEFKQQCGDTLIVIEKVKEKSSTNYMWKCRFLNYPCEVLATKSNILIKQVDNPALPWKTKENLENFLQKYYHGEKVTVNQLFQDINICSIQTLYMNLKLFGLKDKYIKTDLLGKENELKDFIKSLGFKVKSYYSKITYKEIDCYLSEFNIGFEFNGNYWHSELFKEYKYHQNKSLEFLKEGIQIYHIYEYDWDLKKNIIESYIKSKLGIFKQKIFARKCEIKKLNNLEYQEFCNQNHIQGQAGAKIKFGLFYNKELVQVMSFGVPRFTDKYEWEIIRECSKLEYLVIGGKQKLWKYFVNNYNPKSVISYCDFGKFQGNSYIKLGFKRERLNSPGFVWWEMNKHEVYNRTPENNLEMRKKYLKIFDAGQLVFVWQKEN